MCTIISHKPEAFSSFLAFNFFDSESLDLSLFRFFTPLVALLLLLSLLLFALSSAVFFLAMFLNTHTSYYNVTIPCQLYVAVDTVTTSAVLLKLPVISLLHNCHYQIIH